MRFYVVPYRHTLPPNAKFPCVQLTRDSWDDFTFVTLFAASYHASKSKQTDLGSVKILQRGRKSPSLDSKFTELPDDCCSLGQSLGYYRAVAGLSKKRRDAILTGLRDAVADPGHAETFQADRGWTKSLLRFSEAELAFREGRRVLDAIAMAHGPITFAFTAKLKGASYPFECSFVFNDSEDVPSRIAALVGKNGAGKTWFLSRLAAAVSGDDTKGTSFNGARPSFNRAVAVSYSALDRFRRPGKERTFSYRYCGIYDEKGKLASRSKMFSRMRDAYETVQRGDNEIMLRATLADALDEETAARVTEYLSETSQGGVSKKPALSSGQLVLASTLTSVVANMEPASLLLYDEPELHLHPNAVAGLMKAIERLLEHFRSFAVIATHSPMILQQVPAKYVRVFTRLGALTTIQPLGIESFGQNLTLLTEQIFKASDTPSRFRDWSRRVAPLQTLEKIQASFDHPLSFEAKMFLRADRGDI